MSKYERMAVRSAKGLKLKKGKKFVELLADKELTLKALNRLADLEDKIESGKMLDLPFKYQDKVWCVEKNQFSKDWQMRQMVCVGIEMMYGKIKVLEDIVRTHTLENVFVTREEAKARLKELKGEQQ